MIRAAALLLTVLTGFSGLVYEVAWQKYLATLLGSHGEATAAVLAIFLGGLALGYSVFGVVTHRAVERAREAGRPAPLFLIYGAVECAIGLYAFAFPMIFGVAQAVSLGIPHPSEGVGFAFDLLLSTLLIGPPTVLMGATIPVLTQALARDLGDATRVHAWIYAFNTIGAFAGALAGGFVVVPLWGLDGTLAAMGFVNVFAGALFVLASRFRRSQPPLPAPVPDAEAAASAARRFLAYASVALLGGFAMMAVQTVLNRVGGLSLGSSNFTFAMIVGAFVLCIALGSFAVSALPRIPSGLLVVSQWGLAGTLALLYLRLPNTPYYAHFLRSLFRDADPGFYPFHIAAFLCALAVLLVPIGLSGALLPLLFHQLRRELGDLGGVAGRLYSWNTVGSLLGAIFGGYLLLLWLDLDDVFRISLAAIVIGAAILTSVVHRISPGIVAGAVLAPALLGVVMLPDWDPERLDAGLFRTRKPTRHTFAGVEAFYSRPKPYRIVFHDDGPTSSVDVKAGPKSPLGPNVSIIVNGKSDGHVIHDYTTMAMAAVLPALVAENPERGFVIGFGTGVTAGELAAIRSMREVTVAEIARGVIAAAPFFASGNLDAAKNEKVRIVRGDAYRTLLRSEGRYDIIVSEPSNPWVTGVEMLYSLEFLEAARSRLTDGGVYAQWFHLYELDASVIEIVLRNYTRIFPHVSVWYTDGPDVLLLGIQDPSRALDVQALAQRFAQPDYRRGFQRMKIQSFAALLAHELLPLGTVNATDLEGEVHTLRHPILSHRAARAFFRGAASNLPNFVSPEAIAAGLPNSLLARYLATDGVDFEIEIERAVREVCVRRRPAECTALMARWYHENPDSPRLLSAHKELRNPGTGAPELRRIQRIARFFDSSSVDYGRGEPLDQSQRATQEFEHFYHYAVPFDQGALEAIWRRCERAGNAVKRCREAPARTAN